MVVYIIGKISGYFKNRKKRKYSIYRIIYYITNNIKFMRAVRWNNYFSIKHSEYTQFMTLQMFY